MSEFIKISRDNFNTFLNEYTLTTASPIMLDEPSSNEIIYEIPTEKSTITIKIYSSVDKFSGITRDIGEDAIRCVLFDFISQKPVGKAKRTHRMTNWKERLKEKLDELKEETKKIQICKTCNSAMVLRNSSRGEFYGCLSYPNCKSSMTLFGEFHASKQSSENEDRVEVVLCPECDAPMQKRSGRKGEFYGCTNFFKTGCKGTRQVNEVEIYGMGIEETDVSQTKLVFPTEEEKPKEKQIELIDTSKFPHMKFKFEKFNPVQSEVFQYFSTDVNCVVAASTSAGKTTVAEMFMSDSISKGKKAIFLSPLKAVSQEKYEDWTNPEHAWSKLNVSIVTGDYQLTDKRVEELNNAHIIIMTTEMLDAHARRINTVKNDWLLNVSTLVQDECFPKSALIRVDENVELTIEKIFNNENIEYVMSYNEKEKKLEKKRILRRIKRSFNEKFISIKYKCDNISKSFICSPNHKIWTDRGYVRADELKHNDCLKTFQISENYKCELCNKRFKNKLIFLKHYGKEHLRKEKFICQECDKEFKRKGDLQHHIHYVHEKTEKKCFNCNRQFINFKSLESHIKKCHDEANFFCPFCNAFFSTRNQLKTHFQNEHKIFKGINQKRKILDYNIDTEAIEIWLHGKNMKVTKLEKKIIELKDENILYTGNHVFWYTLGKLENGKFWKKNPDFKIINQKKVIEVGNLYWHSKEEIKQVIEAYEKIGIQCLYLTNIDIENDWENTKEKIKTFIHNHKSFVERIKFWGSKATKRCFVYNLEIEDNHNYIANNVLVSNCHLLTVKGRGDKAESAIMRFTKQNPSCRVVFLSATMPNVDELARWLTSLNGKKTELINSTYRPCQLDIHYEKYDDYGKYKTVEVNKLQRAVEITQQYKNDKFIVFVHAKNMGCSICAALKNIGENVELHNSELTMADRVRIPNEFKEKNGVRIIVATSTLAWGINLPCRRCVVVGVHRGIQEVEPLDIAQMVGRSGRVGLDPKGDAHVLLPQSKFTRYKNWCEDIPPILSTMNDESILAFHIISEISEGEVYDISTLMEWYNRSLAAFQSNFLDRVDAEELLTKLEKIKVIEKIGNRYKITKLGRVAAYLYYSPYSIAGWYFNFNKLFKEERLDDHSISWALSNIPDNNNNFAGREMKDMVSGFVTSCRNRNLIISEACAIVGVYFNACLSYSDEIGEYQKRQVKFDSERMCSALEMIDNMYAHWNRKDFWKKLQLRIEYEVTDEQTELCMLKGIGGVRVRKLFEEGIMTIFDFKRRDRAAQDILGKTLYNKVIEDNNL